MDRDGRECFLVLMADQLAPAWLPIYGHPLVQTPHLASLASEGTVFDAAYCPFPLCAPSRASMLTGQYASAVGVYDNAAELPASVPTAVHALRAAGYQTTLVGKMHFVGPDQLHGFEERLTTDIYPADLDWTPDWNRDPGERLPWYHTMESLLTPGVCGVSMQTDYDREVSTRRASFSISPATGTTGPSCSSSHSPTHTTRGRFLSATGRATDGGTSSCQPFRGCPSSAPTPTAAGCGRCAGSMTPSFLQSRSEPLGTAITRR